MTANTEVITNNVLPIESKLMNLFVTVKSLGSYVSYYNGFLGVSYFGPRPPIYKIFPNVICLRNQWLLAHSRKVGAASGKAGPGVSKPGSTSVDLWPSAAGWPSTPRSVKTTSANVTAADNAGWRTYIY